MLKKLIKILKPNGHLEPNLLAFLTLFSFSTIARGIQFLVPLIVSFIFKPDLKVDSYFYWSTQVNLAATLISSIWPSTLMAVLVKAKALHSGNFARDFSSLLIRRYCLFAMPACLLLAVLAENGTLGGSQSIKDNLFFLEILVSSACISISLALAEIGTASRQFAIAYKSILANALLQLILITVFPNENLLLAAFTLGAIIQLITTLILLPGAAKIFWGKLNYLANIELSSLIPPINIISFLYIGSLLSTISSHLSFRILDDQIGAVSAFALASMLALSPQQLLINQLGTVSGVSMAECFQKQSRNIADVSFLRVVNNWRRRLFKSSIIAGLAVAYSAFFAVAVLPIYFKDPVIADHWQKVAYMCIFLSLPLAACGLTNWFSRLYVAIEKIDAGVYFQISANIILIILLLAASRLQSAYASCIALAIFACLQIPAMELFAAYLLKKDKTN